MLKILEYVVKKIISILKNDIGYSKVQVKYLNCFRQDYKFDIIIEVLVFGLVKKDNRKLEQEIETLVHDDKKIVHWDMNPIRVIDYTKESKRISIQLTYMNKE